jgi:hypothetical protein
MLSYVVMNNLFFFIVSDFPSLLNKRVNGEELILASNGKHYGDGRSTLRRLPVAEALRVGAVDYHPVPMGRMG